MIMNQRMSQNDMTIPFPERRTLLTELWRIVHGSTSSPQDDVSALKESSFHEDGAGPDLLRVVAGAPAGQTQIVASTRRLVSSSSSASITSCAGIRAPAISSPPASLAAATNGTAQVFSYTISMALVPGCISPPATRLVS